MISFPNFLVILLSTAAVLVFGSEIPKARILRSTQTRKQNEDVEYHVQIREKGVHFNETMKINTDENTVYFSVPAHNDVARSDVLMDYNLNLTITRLPDLGICHIKPLDRQYEPLPKKMNDDMEHASINNNNKRRGILSKSTEWAIDKPVNQRNLSLSVRKFCVGFDVYSLKEIDEDDVVVEKELAIPNNDGKARKKRQTNFQLCKRSYTGTPCNPNDWVLQCKFVASGSTCVYWITCQLPVGQLNNNLQNCGAVHNWSSVMCCYPVCPT